MARKSKRKRRKLRQNHVQVMDRVEGVGNIQRCPKCLTTIKDHRISQRICFRCSPKAAANQLKTDTTEPVSTPPENVSSDSYGRTEAYLRSSCLDNSFRIPEEFESWQIYFWSRGSMLREWSRWLAAKLSGKMASVQTDMTPGKDLERKIRERREASGTTGPGFKTVVEQKADNLRGESYTSYRTYSEPSRAEPAIPRPTGAEGSHHFVI